MGLIKWLADSISENLNLKTDLELEQEYLHLQEKYNELDSLYESMHERLITSSDNFEKLAKENKSLVTENDRVTENYQELINKRTPTVLKERCIELQNELKKSEAMRKLNYSLSEAKSFIDKKENKKIMIECLHHNFKHFVDANNILIPQLAKKYENKVSSETLRRIYIGDRGSSVTTFDFIEGDMCEFYGCMPLDLVTKKLPPQATPDECIL